MSTIPASDIVDVIPGVLPAAGQGAAFIGLVLDNSTRVPTNGTDSPQVLSFPSAQAVESYAGPGTTLAQFAADYFLGFDNSQLKPAALLIAQYNQSPVSAYLRGGNASALLSTLQGITGGIFEVIVDGFSWKSTSVNFSSDNTLSAIAATLQSSLALPSSASVTGSIVPYVQNRLGDIGLMTVTAVSSGVVAVGQVVTGSSVLAGTYVIGYGTGSGGNGTYYVNLPQTVASETLSLTASAASFTASITGHTTLSVSAVASGTIQPGMVVTGSGVQAGTTILSLISGSPTGVSTWKIYPSQNNQASESMTGAPANIAVTYDSVSQGFVITSGTEGPISSIAYATRNLATLMLLTQATGAVTSQGADVADPIGFMNGVIAQTINWLGYTYDFDPDDGAGNAQKLLFAQWTNSQNSQFAFFALDADPTPTESTSATSSLGYLIGPTQSNYAGTVPISSPAFDIAKAALAISYSACLNFNALGGRTTFARRAQSGITAEVTSETVAANLRANGYDGYGVWANAGGNWIGFFDGTISGPFQWIDSFVNQVWLNNALQTALMTLLFSGARTVPFNNNGAGLIRAACLDPITAAINFGAIVPGGQLSLAQIAEINNAAGNQQAATAVANNGYYLQVSIPPPAVRQARGPWPITLWYFDGGAVQSIVMNSIDVQ